MLSSKEIKKIRNKERCGFRGKKVRYSLWRARYNVAWEHCHRALALRICKDNDLNVEDYLSQEKRNPWEHTYNNLQNLGFYMLTASYKEVLGDSGLLDQSVIEDFCHDLENKYVEVLEHGENHDLES